MEQELAANDKQQADLRERIKRLDAEKEEWRVCIPFPDDRSAYANMVDKTHCFAKDAQLGHFSDAKRNG